jgi:hypothetical protein
MNRLSPIVGALGVAVVGICLLLYPAKIQEYVFRCESDNWAWRINPFKEWMKTPSYLTHLRFMGVFLLLFAALLIALAVFAH